MATLPCNFTVAFVPTETTMNTNTDRIEKQVLLKAPRERVWRALSEADQFGTWFGVRFDGPFVEGERLTGKIAPTQVDEEVAAMQTPYEGTPFEWLRSEEHTSELQSHVNLVCRLL